MNTIVNNLIQYLNFINWLYFILDNILFLIGSGLLSIKDLSLLNNSLESFYLLIEKVVNHTEINASLSSKISLINSQQLKSIANMRNKGVVFDQIPI